MAEDAVEAVLTRLGLGGDHRDANDVRALVEYVIELGATTDEIVASAVLESLGPMALDFSIRPTGETMSLDEFASTSGLDARLVRDLWVALGLPENPPMPFPVTPDLGDALRVLDFLIEPFGEEAVLGFARVIGSSAERIADALANAMRVGVEVPRRGEGRPFREVVHEYSSLARELLPPFWDAIGAVFRRHLVLVSYEGFEPEKSQHAVTLQRAIGFVDLVGSTEVLRAQSVPEMAASVNRFERLVGDRVTTSGGRVVKLIGDEAMFAFIDLNVACRCALELIDVSPSAVRVGIAFGDVVAMHGDYFGPTVNLAARLVSIAPPSTLVVSREIGDILQGFFDFSEIETGPLRGFPEVTTAWVVRAK